MNRLFKCLGDENRLRMINLLLQRDLCVCEIEVLLMINQSNASRHIAKLKSEGVIKSNKDGNFVHYMVSRDFIKNNNELLKFLVSNFDGSPYIDDINRLDRYLESGLDCQDITHDRDRVEKIIGGDVLEQKDS